MELADTSAWTNRHKSPEVQAAFNALVVGEQIATCPAVVMELLWTARNPREFDQLRADLGALPQLSVPADAWMRAMDVWRELARNGRHRQVKHVDLLIAAVAELAGVGLCHYDGDFDAIAEVTRQPVRAITPLGTL